MHSAIAELIGIPDKDVAGRITAGEAFQDLQRLLNVLFRYRVQSLTQLERLDNLNKRLDGNGGTIIGINAERNELLHGAWKLVIFLGKTRAMKSKRSKMNLRKYKAEFRFVEVAELENLIVKINDTTRELRQLMEDNRELIKDHIKAYNALWESNNFNMVKKFNEKYYEEEENWQS